MTSSRQLANRSGQRSAEERQGSAVVELAVCLPVIFTIVFGSIQASNLLHLQNALESAAHQGALAAITHAAEESDVVSGVQDMMDARGVQGATVSLAGIGKPFSDVARGEQFEITVSAPAAPNITGPTVLAMSSTLEAKINAIKQ